MPYVDYHDVQYYNHLKKELTQSQIDKAIKFVHLGLIEYAGENIFICKKMQGYNTRNYTLTKNSDWGWECNCQGWQSKLKKYETEGNARPSCSHVSALYLYFMIKHETDWNEAQKKIDDFKEKIIHSHETIE